jgi:hypothetical protein
MEKNLLAAIMGAISAYIQQGEASQAASNGMTSWWLRGQREQVRARTNVQGIKHQPGVVTWRHYGLEEAMTARARLMIKK